MTAVASFSNSVFDYINTQYGKDILSIVKSEKNKTVVNKLIESSIM